MRPAQRNDPGDSGVARVAALLTAFRAGDAEVGVSELARRTGISKSAAHRLVGQLVEQGLLERDGARVRLGLRLFEIGQLAVRQQGLVDAARPLLADLRAASRNTVHLAVLEGAEVVYLDVLPGPNSPRLPSRVGGRFPAHATGVGKAILAYSHTDVIERVLQAGLGRVSARTITTPAALRRQLDKVRSEGIAYEREESGSGTVCVAAPVLDPGGCAVAAVSVAGWSNRMRPERIAPAVRTVGLTLSRTLH